MTIERIDVSSQRFRELRARHEGFWKRADGSLLRSAGVFTSGSGIGLRQPDGSVLTRVKRLTPDMIDPAAMLDEAEEWTQKQVDAARDAPDQFVLTPGLGDLLPMAHCLNKVPWLEAVVGCPVEMTDGQIWSEPYEGDPRDIIARGANFEHNPWLQLYEEFLRLLQERFAGRFPVTANTLLRGNCDLVAAILGVREACIAWLDDPQLVSKLMRVCTDANLAAIEAGNKIVKPFAGGYLSGFGIWAPGPVLRTQADHSTLLSPLIYEKQIMPYDIEVFKSCAYSVIHLHNPGVHIVPLLVQIPELSAIEVVVDPYPSPARRVIEMSMYRLVQEHKPLIIDGNFPSQQEAEAALSELSPRGLCYNPRFDEATFASLPTDWPGRRPWLLE